MANMYGNGSYYGFTMGNVPSIFNWINVGMWVGLPCLFLWSPIRTRSLRLIVSGCVLVLMVCVSFIHITYLPHSRQVIYWLMFYGSSFAFALLRRNWGKVVFFERGATIEQLERISTKTLLELMGIASLACSFILFWSRRMDDALWFSLLIALVHGIVTLLLSVTYFKIALDQCRSQVRILAILWLLNGIGMFIIGFVHTIDQNPRSFASAMELWYLSTLVGFSFGASLLLVLHLLVCSMWLRACGWHSKLREEDDNSSVGVRVLRGTFDAI
jgi:hypothetical protein